jgi:probable rRNA maturation factor
VSGNVVVQRRVPPAGIPAAASLRRWAMAARGRAAGELTLRVVAAAESRALNHRYRGADKPTNVLSFPADPGLPGAAALGDIVICAPVVAAEAVRQRKPARAHWAHMVVHGVLHLLGYDHMDGRGAERMEARERMILASLGFADPYQDQ